MRFPALDPAETDYGIVLRMRGVYEQDYVIFVTVLLEVFVLFAERLLSGGSRFSQDQFGLLVDAAETAQYRRHPA